MVALRICERAVVGRVLAVLVLVVAGLGALPQPAWAEACGTQQNLQTGWSTNHWTGGPEPMTYEGVSAVILDRGGYVLCTTDTNGGVNFSTTWTMVFGSSGGYAQSGTMYRWGYGTCVKRWAEQNWGSGWADYYIGGCSNPGESHKYWQQALWTGSAWVERSNIDSTVIHQSSFSPFATWSTPFHVAFSAETYYAQSHIAGTATAKQDYSSMQVQSFANDGWYGSCGNANLGSYNYNPTRWGVDAPACNHVRTWTR